MALPHVSVDPLARCGKDGRVRARALLWYACFDGLWGLVLYHICGSFEDLMIYAATCAIWLMVQYRASFGRKSQFPDPQKIT